MAIFCLAYKMYTKQLVVLPLITRKIALFSKAELRGPYDASGLAEVQRCEKVGFFDDLDK